MRPTRVRIDAEAGECLGSHKFGGWVLRRRRSHRDVLDPPTVGCSERRTLGVIEPQLETTLMHQAMVPWTKTDEVVEARFTAVSPMLDVMSVEPAGVSAAGKSAAAIANEKSATDGRRNRPGLAANVEHTATVVGADGDEAGVAGDATKRFRGNAAAVFERCALVFFKNVRRQVEEKRGALASGTAKRGVQLCGILREEPFGESEEAIGAAGQRWRIPGCVRRFRGNVCVGLGGLLGGRRHGGGHFSRLIFDALHSA